MISIKNFIKAYHIYYTVVRYTQHSTRKIHKHLYKPTHINSYIHSYRYNHCYYTFTDHGVSQEEHSREQGGVVEAVREGKHVYME